VPDILDMDRLAPGTLIVDDSSPHCFRVDRAARRIREQQDILFTEGGMLRAPQPMRQVIYVPAGLERHVPTLPAALFANYDAHHITGCVLSSLLTSKRPELTATLGLVSPHACFDHYRALENLGFQAARLHCEEYAVDEDAVREFRRQFGLAESEGTDRASTEAEVTVA